VSTENVAILFTDIVGSTELSYGLSVEGADEVRRGHFAILRKAIAEYGGNEVKNLGDGLMVVFPAASAALACGVAMQQGVDQNSRRRQVVGLRVGLSVGEVSREDDDFFGDAVVEAARLCARCESGQILAAELVLVIAGRRVRYECRSLGPLPLKGLPEPLETVEVLWEPVTGDGGMAVPLPARLAVRPDVGVVGREAEIETMAEAMKRVTVSGNHEVVLVSGEAGLGKTTLVAETARWAFESGACVLFGHCEEGLATPYQLFAEALGHYVTHAPEDRLRLHVETTGSDLAGLIPSLTRRIPDLPSSTITDSDSERYLLFAAVVGLLSAMSEDRAVVLVLDDLQWADSGSLLLLRYLAASTVSLRLLVVGNYRDSELPHSHALVEALAALRRQERVTRIELKGLDDVGVVDLMEAAAGHPLDDNGVGLAHAIHRETDGNPFFVSEVLRNLVETGSIRQNAEGFWQAEPALEGTALPDSIREVIGARVLRLGKEASRILGVAAVIGRDFDLDLLCHATSTTDDQLLDVLEDAAAAALVQEPADASGRYSFAHALIQHTLYEDMGPNRRARAHRQVAESLEELCGDRPGIRVGELARHWMNATQPTDLSKAIDYSRQAGDAALRALAPADALRYYAQAVDLFSQTSEPDPIVGIDLAVGLGTAQRQCGDPAFRATLLDAARRAADLDDTSRLVSAALANDRGFFSMAGTTDPNKIEILEMALDRLPAEDPDRSRVLACLCSELTYGSALDRRKSLAEQAMAIAGATEDDATIVWVLNHVYVALCVPELMEESWTRTAEALTRSERMGDPLLQFFATGFRACTATHFGDVDEAARCLDAQTLLAEQLNQPMLDWLIAWMRGGQAQIIGSIDEAERLANASLELGTEAGQEDAFSFFGPQLIIVNFQRGTLGDLLPLVEQIEPALPNLDLGPVFALVHVEAGRTEEALPYLREFASQNFTMSIDPIWLLNMSCYAESIIQCHMVEYAEPVLRQLTAWAHLLANTGGLAVFGPVTHFLGGLACLLDRYDDAENYFRQAADFSARIGASFFGARTNLAWGEMCAKRQRDGDAERARNLLDAALSSASSNGYAVVEQRAIAALRSLN
jgi:class 3 adenylate cyclase/tetratricopeptide (TPR) repeat protein